MIWQYFPIGFRFPVSDFSNETKRACWNVALSALFASEAEGVTLYDAQQTYDVGSGGPVYMCIACFYGIKQARACAKKLYALDGLMTQLTVYRPFIQANALESFGPFSLIGKFEPEGGITPTEDGGPLLNDLPHQPMQRPQGARLLIVSEEGETEGEAETGMRILGTEAAQNGFYVRRLLLANGGAGTVRALVTGTDGRYESVAVNDGNGDRKDGLIGILPGKIAVIESKGNDAVTIGALIGKALDLGYRRIRVGTGGCIDPQNALRIPEALGMRFFDETDEPVCPDADRLARIARTDRSGLDPRLALCECKMLTAAETEDDSRIAALLQTEPKRNPLCSALASIGFTAESGAETVYGAIDFEQRVRQSDYVMLLSRAVEGETARIALSELNAQKKPTVLIATGSFDADRLMREIPVLRGAVRIDEPSAEALKTAFCGEVLPLIGKYVAKTTQI